MKTIKHIVFLICLSLVVGAQAATTTKTTTNTFVTDYTAAADGDILLLDAGTYSSPVKFPDGKAITLKKDPDAATTPVLNFLFTESTSVADVDYHGGSITFDGIEINRGVQTYLFNYESSDVRGMKAIRFLNCTITGITTAILRVNQSTNTGHLDELIFDNCLITECAAQGGGGAGSFIQTRNTIGIFKCINSTIYKYYGGTFFNISTNARKYAPEDALTVQRQTNIYVEFSNNTMVDCFGGGTANWFNGGTEYKAGNTVIFKNNICDQSNKTYATADARFTNNANGVVQDHYNLKIGYTTNGGTFTLDSKPAQPYALGTAPFAAYSAIPFEDKATGKFKLPASSAFETAGMNGYCLGDPSWIENLPTMVVIAATSEDANGTVAGSGNYGIGSTAILTAVPAQAYDLAGWYDGETLVSTANPYTFTVSEERTLTAKFYLPASATITVLAADANGVVSGGGVVVIGRNATITATPITDYGFDGWYDGETFITMTNPYVFAVTENKTFTAHFKALPRALITVEAANANGSVTGGGSIVIGRNTTITSIPVSGYEFDGWYDGGTLITNINPYTFVVSTDKTITAHFKVASEIEPANLQTLIDAAASGATILLEPGKYTTPFAIPAGKAITLKNKTANRPIFDFQITSWGEGGSVTFDGIVINPTIRNIFINSTATTSINVALLKFVNCKISNVNRLYVSEGAGHISEFTVDNCILSNVGVSSTTFIAPKQTLGEFNIKNSTIWNYTSSNILILGSADGSTIPIHCSIINNTIVTAHTAVTSLISGNNSNKQNNVLGYYILQNNIMENTTTTAGNRPSTQTGLALQDDYNIKVGYQNSSSPVQTSTGAMSLGSGAFAGITAFPFADRAIGDFTIANKKSSPFYTNGKSGNCLGDPRWYETRYTVTVVAEANGVVSGTASIAPNDFAIIKATPNVGYKFDGWYDGATEVSTANQYAFEVTADKTYTAKFSPATSVVKAEKISTIEFAINGDNLQLSGLNGTENIQVVGLSGAVEFNGKATGSTMFLPLSKNKVCFVSIDSVVFKVVR